MSKLKISAHDRILIFAPHPDDESLAAGGLIQRAVRAGAKVRAVLVTDGDNNPWPQRFVERRLKIRRTDRARWGRRRRKEALAALAHLGLDPATSVRFMGWPDQGVTNFLLAANENALFALWAEIMEWKPTLIVTPSGADTHPDHNAFFVLAQIAAARLEKPPRVLRYLIHAPKHHSEKRRATLHLSDEEIETKRAAILCHESQMALSRKRFVGYAGEQEVFFESEPVREDHRHPISSAWIERGGLRLEIKLLRRRRASFSSEAVLMAFECATEGSVRWILQMPTTSQRAEIIDAKTGEPTRFAAVRIRGKRAEVSVPISALQPLRHVFVKLQRKFFLYDEAGWRAVPLSDAAATASSDADETAAGTQTKIAERTVAL